MDVPECAQRRIFQSDHNKRPRMHPRFDFDGAQELDRAEYRLARELIEAWQSDANSINRSFDLPVPYEAVKHHWLTRGGPMRKEVAGSITSDYERPI
ncbi:unnamed protein product [Schistocephalus solidus]|uniref:Transposase n=1 Tax=Schistocephalus solidus TaxID=70667 RepID=A0A183TTT9_SCHSO|nr:unnamed protein product [Schistocephalus solidus]